MIIKHNQMRMFRRKAGLSQDDIAHMLECRDHGSISKWEQGRVSPPLRVMMLYNILFGIPIENLFLMQRRRMSEDIRDRIESRIEHLQDRRSSHKVTKRIAFLEGSLGRINPNLDPKV